MKKLLKNKIILSIICILCFCVIANAATDTVVVNGVTYVKQNSVKDVVKKVNQSVVAIIGESKKTGFLDDYYYSKIPAGLMHGSGVVVSKDGRIITNNHVVEDMKEIFVVFPNKKTFKAKLLYKNKDIDLALIKINTKNLKPIEFEKTENINVGDDVIAVGTPLSFNWLNSVSRGIISGLNRPVDQVYSYLQTDVAINPGNSGGPLVNMEGKLIGINTLGIMFFQGVNFAIPVENVKYFIDQYNKNGKIKRAYTGIEFEESWIAVLGIPNDQGLKAIGLRDDAIFDKNSIKEGDLLTKIDNENINSMANLIEILKTKEPETEAEFTFTRNGSIFKIKAKLKEYSE